MRQPGSQEFVSFVDHVCDFATCLGKIDKACITDCDQFLFTKIFHRNANAGFFKAKFIGNINGANNRELSAQDQDRL